MKQITLSLMTLIISALLLIGCGGGGGGSSGGSSSPEPLLNTTADGDGSGGGGDGNNGGGGGNGNGSNGDGGGERPSLPAEVELSISPFIDGLRIQWHNLSAIEGAGGIYIHLNLTGGNPPQPDERKIAIEDFSDDSYEIDGLDNGTAYRLVGVRVEQANNTFWVIDNITWSEPWQAKTNALDNNGGGIVVGANHDGDGRADGLDEDDDNDGRPNSMDDCRLGEIGWLSTNRTLDYDSDGCRNDEDPDGDNDGILNEDEAAPRCVLNEDCDGDDVLDGDELVGCVLKPDCDDDNEPDNTDTDNDNDGIDDSDEASGCALKPNCDGDAEPDNIDIDDDGDGLIEIRNASELDAVRWVLNGTGFKANEMAMPDQTGCGNGADMTVCNGYELVRDIFLTDYIADNYPIVGWQPIALDNDSMTDHCQGDRFTGIFDGNGFEVRGLFINRSLEDCIGLFGQADGIIRNLGVIADRIIGGARVGSLIGYGVSTKVIQSYAVTGEVRGEGILGSLAGDILDAEVVQSYAVSSEVIGSRGAIGGLIGWNGVSSKVIQSYAVSGSVMTDGLSGENVGGLVGINILAEVIQSYAVSGVVSGRSARVGGLIGLSGDVRNSYWDRQTSGRNNDGVDVRGSGNSGQTTEALRSPTDYGDTGIYSTWDDGAIREGTTIAGVDHNGTIWCDEDASSMIEDAERRDAGDANGDNRVWDFGTSTDYPALRCTGDSLADQRAWWFLNTTTHKPQLNQTRLDAYLDGTLP